MSVRIHSGFELVGHSLASALTSLKALRPLVRETALDFAAKEVVALATQALDRHALGLPEPDLEPGLSYLLAAGFSMNKRLADVRRTGGRDPSADFSFEVVLIPVEDRLLGVCFSQHAQLERLLEGLEGYRPLPYWDNQCPSQGVDEAEWAQRRALWQRALPDWGSPAENGLRYVFISDAECLALDAEVGKLSRLHKGLPALPRRSAWATGELLDAGQDLGVPAPATVSGYIELLRSPEWGEVCTRVGQRLPQPLTVDVLRAKVPGPFRS